MLNLACILYSGTHIHTPTPWIMLTQLHLKFVHHGVSKSSPCNLHGQYTAFSIQAHTLNRHTKLRVKAIIPVR